MGFTLFTITAFTMGFLSAIPSGPVQIEVARRSINGYLAASVAIITGAFTADVLYGIIALYGLAPFLVEETVQAVFWLGGAVFLTAVAVKIFIDASKPRDINPAKSYLAKKRWGFANGFILAVINPMMILWWLMGKRLLVDIGLVHRFSAAVTFWFIALGALGLAAYLLCLSFFLTRTKHFIPSSKVVWINRVFGAALVGFAAYFFYSSMRVIL